MNMAKHEFDGEAFELTDGQEQALASGEPKSSVASIAFSRISSLADAYASQGRKAAVDAFARSLEADDPDAKSAAQVFLEKASKNA